MTGFIRGLFRAKPNAENTEAPQNGASTPTQQSKAFYLDPDDAKTFGDINYMRMAKSVKRSFPKNKMGGDNEIVRNISSMEMKDVLAAVPDSPTAANGSLPASPATGSFNQGNEERRRTDSSMDMFRNMARDINKRR